MKPTRNSFRVGLLLTISALVVAFPYSGKATCSRGYVTHTYATCSCNGNVCFVDVCILGFNFTSGCANLNPPYCGTAFQGQQCFFLIYNKCTPPGAAPTAANQTPEFLRPLSALQNEDVPKPASMEAQCADPKVFEAWLRTELLQKRVK